MLLDAGAEGENGAGAGDCCGRIGAEHDNSPKANTPVSSTVTVFRTYASLAEALGEHVFHPIQ
ncbi:hypothetical protein [Amycolatopsis sp. H20-H5]|uniref:hypothetical protein n=1 Tax=Amycolatopsis sp. H20-H5 TaxID=3046309 RepID=UPI002DBF82BC|nr:hypothetical protein [Amycolatopsis sp. H20-H5]MEC3981184.1 hypothetical protein [Amycolatopsis sp. H20-H5]